MIGWLRERWQGRYPGVVFAAGLLVVAGGGAVLGWWILRDLSRGLLLRPALAVLALAVVSVRVIVSFHPNRRR